MHETLLKTDAFMNAWLRQRLRKFSQITTPNLTSMLLARSGSPRMLSPVYSFTLSALVYETVLTTREMRILHCQSIICGPPYPPLASPFESNNTITKTGTQRLSSSLICSGTTQAALQPLSGTDSNASATFVASDCRKFKGFELWLISP